MQDIVETFDEDNMYNEVKVTKKQVQSQAKVPAPLKKQDLEQKAAPIIKSQQSVKHATVQVEEEINEDQYGAETQRKEAIEQTEEEK